MTIFRVLVLTAMTGFAPLASACQQILADHPGIRDSAELVAEAVVVSSTPVPGRTPNAMDPARVLDVRLIRVIKGKAPKTLKIPTVPCYVGGYNPGRLVTVVRFPDGEYHVVERPQR
jgi:hypothetical protein